MTTRRTFVASLLGTTAVSIPFAKIAAQGDHGSHGSHGDATPSSMAVCATPMAGHGEMMGTPMAMMDFDLAYIDMMIPHHESIIALAEVAVDELEDERLVAIAEAIIATQQGEIDELRELREEWYGSPEPAAMSAEIMQVSMGMHDDCIDEHHMSLMSAEALVQQFEEAENKDLAFIELSIPHHQMAIDTSEIALEQAEHQEIRDIAELVIEAQEGEIAELEMVRNDIEGTPAA
jgi:uncharacterized protein (DUF305 family)